MKVFHPENFQILLVDGTSDNLLPTIAALEATGYNLSYVSSQENLLEAIATFRPDLMLLNLTKLEEAESLNNKIKLCQILQTYPNFRSIPIVFTIRDREQEEAIELIDDGTVDYLSEPFNPLEVLICIRTHLKLKQKREKWQKAYAELEKLVNTDPLTEIANRRASIAFGEREFHRAKRYAHPFSILTIDIDRFKQVNDTYGHDIGDRLLVQVSKIVTHCLRKADCFGRFGGEEFLVLLPETEQPQAAYVAERIRNRIAKTSLTIEEENIIVTVSIGIATYHADDRSLDVILKRADRALYEAKRLGRNRVVINVDNDGSSLKQLKSSPKRAETSQSHE
jgi:diguanylate cyclase (GGDEF)-like protein